MKTCNVVPHTTEYWHMYRLYINSVTDELLECADGKLAELIRRFTVPVGWEGEEVKYFLPDYQKVRISAKKLAGAYATYILSTEGRVCLFRIVSLSLLSPPPPLPQQNNIL
jgi:hypothetical protein